VAGRPVGTTAREAIRQGVYLVPEDRKRTGLILDSSIAENIALPDLASHAPRGIVRGAALRATAARMKRALDIRATGPDVVTGTLSGGNQQKVVLAKWLALKPRVLICDEPTRGIDVGAKAEIYRVLRGLADSGVAVLMISSDMEEVIGVSDRVAVMHEGCIGGILERRELSEHAILLLATGAGSARADREAVGA
jgi:ribose transport system ATP-binding protein